MTRRAKRAPVVLLAIALAAAVTIVITIPGASSDNRLPTRLHADRPSVVSPRLRKVFKVLRERERSKSAAVGANSEPLPPAVEEGMSSQAGLDPSEAAFAPGAYPTWVVPGTTMVCLVIGSTGPRSVPSSACASISAAEQHGLAITTETDAGAPVVVGLVPNGNSTVTVTGTDGATSTVPVNHNVYEITSGNPRTVSLKQASGASTSRYVALPPLPPPTAPSGSTP